MPAPEHEPTRHSETADGDAVTPTSRRTFLVLAGTAGSLGVSAAPAVGRRSDGRQRDERITIVASHGERETAREAVGRLQDARGGPPATVDVASTTRGASQFTAGEGDVLVGSRPLLPDERSRANEHGVNPRQRELPTASATLTRPEPSWVDPLRPGAIADTWSADGPVTTWAEVASNPERTDAGPTGVGQTGVGQTEAGQTDAGRTDEMSSGSRTSADECDGAEAILVRGVRAAQYASGHGGVGYYEPEADWLGSNAGGSSGDGEANTEIARLAFVGVDRSSVSERVADEIHAALAATSADRVGDVPYFDDPYGVGTT